MTARISNSSATAVRQGKSKVSSAFLAALNRRHRGRKPSNARSNSSHQRRPPGPSYAKAARLQPKMWTGEKATKPAAARHKIARKRSRGKVSGEELPVKPQEQEEAYRDSPEEEPEEPSPSRKKRRLNSPPPSVSPPPSFLKSDLLRRRYGGGGLVRRLPVKAVSFANPIVSEVRTRPRTPREDVARLFYNRSDELRFRREERLRRRGKVVILDSDDEESDSDDDVVAVVVGETDETQDGCQDKLRLCGNAKEGLNEVTESDDSSSSSSDEDTDSD